MVSIDKEDLADLTITPDLGSDRPAYKRDLGQVLESINSLVCYNGDLRNLSRGETMEFLKKQGNINWKLTRKVREIAAAEFFVEGSYEWSPQKKKFELIKENLRLKKYWENHLTWRNDYLFKRGFN